MNRELEMYDSARTKEWLVRNGYGTVTSASVKKNNNHWSKNIFSPWKKKPSSAEKSGLVHADQQQQLQQHLNGHHHAESLYALQMRVPNGGHHHHYNVVVPSPGPGGVGGRFCSLSAATANVYLSRPAEHLTYSVVPVTASDHHHHHHTHHQNNRQQSVSYHSATVRSPTRTSARQRTSLFASQWEPIHQSQFDHERIISHPDQREREDVHDLEQLNQLRYDKKVTKCTCDTARSTRSNYSQSARTRAMNATFSASSKPPFCAYHHNSQKEQLPPARHPVAVSNVRGSSTISGSQTRTLPDGNQFSRYFDLRNGFDPAASPSDGQPKRPERRVTGGATVNEKLLRSLNGSRDTFSSLASRKSFFALANELSAYDLIQKRYQSDLDDDLSDNVLEKPEICEDAALVEVEEEEETRNCEKSHADASAVKSGTGPRKAKPRAAMFHSVSRARHKKSVSVSNNTSSPSVGGPANDLLTSNRRIGGQGMFLFSRDKSQQMESSGLSGGSSSSNTTSGGLGSVKSKAPPKTRFDDLNSVNQVAACDEVTSKGAPPTESHFTVPEPDYDLSDEDVAPESGPLVACHHSSVVMADKASPLTSGSNNNNNNIPRPPPLPPTGPPSVQPLANHQLAIQSVNNSCSTLNCNTKSSTGQSQSGNKQPSNCATESSEEESSGNLIQELKSAFAARSILKRSVESSPNHSGVNGCSNDSANAATESINQQQKQSYKSNRDEAISLRERSTSSGGNTSPAGPRGGKDHITRTMSKLKPHKRSRKHVTFRPCALDETIDINEPIPEEDESLYDDIYTTGSTGSTSSSPSSCPPDHDVPADAAAAGDHHEDKPHHYQGEELSVNLAWGVEHEVTPDLVHKSNARQSGRQAGAGYLPSLVTSPSLSSVAEVEETSGGREELLNCCTQGEECEERNALVEVDQRSSATSASGSSGAETFKSDEITELQSARQFVNNDADNEAIKKAKKEMANNEIFADMRHHVADGDDVDVEEQQVTSAPAASVPIASNLTVADNLNASVISNEFNLLARRNSYRKKFNSYRKHGGSKKSLKEDTVKYTTTKIVIDVPLGNIYESVEGGRADSEPIYEELAHVGNNNVDHLDACQRSIFEGASKDQILEYLEDAKERVEILIDCDHSGSILLPGLVEDEPESQLTSELTTVSLTDCQFASSTSSSIGNSSHVINRRNRTSNVSNSSTDSAMTSASSLETDDSDQVTTASSSPTGKCPMGGLGLSSSLSQLVERNDSGVGAETSKPAKLRRSVSVTIGEAERLCTDCEQSCEPAEEEETGLLFYPLTCEKCSKRRTERKEIIGEFVDTEFKYGRDLRIVREEFYRPMEVSGLLNKDQLKLIFLNLDELIQVNSSFSERLQDALDIATEQGDEDLTTVNIGKIFNDSSLMLNAFETYCIRHGPASLLLTNLEKEKELLRIFLRVSQMENALLRRMNLSAFLMVPVQRVTKYPLLLNRLYKVTPYHHRDRESLKAIQQKVELHLELINQQTKSTQSRTWRRISSLSHSSSHRRLMSVARSLGIFK